MHPEIRLARSAKSAAIGAAMLFLVPWNAQAFDFGVKAEAGAAAALTAPQSERFAMGGGPSAKAMLGVGRYADLTAGAGFVGLPAAPGAASSEVGTAWSFGAGARVKRPHDEVRYYGVSPWVDADALYVRTGPLNRPGFSAGAGLGFPVDDSRRYWIGPFARYLQVLQEPDRAGYDNRDLKTLIIGVSFEAGSSPYRAKPATYIAVMPEQVAAREPIAAPVPEAIVVHEKVILKPDRLQLMEKIQFEWDSDTLEAASYSALDAVVLALQDHPGFRVQMQGHASSEGLEAHNLNLSERRAEAVLDYLSRGGISRDRLTSKGLSSSDPLQSNGTRLGREANRRVEFAVEFIILDKGSNP